MPGGAEGRFRGCCSRLGHFSSLCKAGEQSRDQTQGRGGVQPGFRSPPPQVGQLAACPLSQPASCLRHPGLWRGGGRCRGEEEDKDIGPRQGRRSSPFICDCCWLKWSPPQHARVPVFPGHGLPSDTHRSNNFSLKGEDTIVPHSSAPTPATDIPDYKAISRPCLRKPEGLGTPLGNWIPLWGGPSAWGLLPEETAGGLRVPPSHLARPLDAGRVAQLPGAQEGAPTPRPVSSLHVARRERGGEIVPYPPEHHY